MTASDLCRCLYLPWPNLPWPYYQVANMTDFDLYRFLGAGGFGMVLLAQKLDTKRFYAIKAPTDTILECGHLHEH